ncbi:MAG: hypothetical protein LUI14_10795 [Lachnospiraceae bacterium]|nr:hypothetical protein [Lachnospiraceae bacterium]
MATVIGIIAIRFLNKYLNDAIIFAVALLFYLICLFSTNYSFMVEEGGAVKKLIDLLGAPQNNFCVSLIWLMCGKTVAKYRLHEKWKTRSILIGLTVALSLLLIEHFELKIFGVWSDTLNDCYIFSVPVAFLIAISILSRNDVIKNGMLLRRMSTVIYCSHFFIAIFVKKLVLILQVPNLLNCTVYFITVIICVVLAYTVVYVGKYIKVLRLLY